MRCRRGRRQTRRTRAVLRDAAAVIGRTAQDRRQTVGRAQRGADSGVGVTLLLMASRGDKPTVATAALMAQLLRTAAAIRDAHREVGNVRDARAVNRAMATLTALPLPAAAPTTTGRAAVEHGAARPPVHPTHHPRRPRCRTMSRSTTHEQ